MIKEGEVINNRYKILNTLGHGGMSDVYEARDPIFKRTVAIKILKNEFVDNIENLIRFQNEARISACLNHQNIIKIYDYGIYENLPFIVNEFVKDQTLRDVIDFKKGLSPKETCLIMLQVCDAVKYLHSKKIIHRDLKPQNMFYGVDGTVKLGDFGISIVIGSKLNVYENKNIIGTVQYLAPELIRKEKPSFQTDIFALGICIFEMITGSVPFDSEETKNIVELLLKKDVPSIRKIIPSVPIEIDEIICKATKRNKEERYKTIEELEKDILSVYKNKKIMNKGNSFLSRFFGLSDK